MIKVLLVDDEIEFVSTLAERLNLKGFAAEWVSRPEDALEKVNTQCYDVVVLDVKMPGINGIDLKRRMQENCTGLKFIFLTGHGCEDAYQDGALEAGEQYYLVKPVKIEALMARIRRIKGDPDK